MQTVIDTLATAAPQNVEQICTALITLILAIWGAFKKGKQVGERN